MTCWKRFSNRKGAITVFVALVMVPVCLVQCAMLDLARGISFRYIGQARLSLALSSFLASFDSRLQDTYGLFGVNQVRVGSIEDTFAEYLAGGDFQVTDYQLQLTDPLSVPDVLGEQITERMKLRTPIRGGQWVFEQLGLIENAEEQGKAALLLAKGNELLSLSEEKLEWLKQLLEGFFPGDTNCVNGYTKAHWLYTERETILMTTTLPDWEDEDVVRRLLSSHREYRALLLIYCEYHNQSIGVIRELQDLAGQIQALITEAKNLCEDDPSIRGMIADLRSQANKISNRRNMTGLEKNLQLLTSKVTAIEWNIEMLDDLDTYTLEPEHLDTFVEHIRLALSLSGIRDDFHTDMLQTDSSDVQAAMPEGNWSIPNAGGKDFEIPAELYKTLPSVLEGVAPSGVVDWIDFQDVHALSSFFDGESFLAGIAQAGDRMVEDILLTDYILDTFGSQADIGRYFTGEIEYILGGHASYQENEDYVKQKLFFLRFVLNLTHVLSDFEKRALAQELGYAIALAVTRGIGGDLFAILIMCTWAACESGIDVSDLFSGEEVPLIKSKETWKSSIAGLLESGEGEGDSDTSLLDFSYEDYLMLLLLVENPRTKLLRVADVIEVNMTEMTGLRYKLSGVYTGVDAVVWYMPDYLTVSMLPGRRKESYVISMQGRQSY
ncbi:MAG: hypothetical protein IKU26_05900 [Clostridia bacterium]|nr:hypothetical protein [Clostridia bacterium]